MLRVGVVGCGDVSQHTYLPKLAAAHARGELEFTAVADAIEGRAASLASKYGIPRFFTSHRDLAESDLDLVVNLTPVQAHAGVTLDCIAAGRHVYTEKPIAGDVETADRIIEAAAAAGVTISAAPAILVHPDVRHAVRWVRDGLIGKVCFIRARGSHPGPDRLADFRTDPRWFYRSGGGPLIDLGVYPLHVITGLLGPAQRVMAFSGNALPSRIVRYGESAGAPVVSEVDDNTHLMLDFGDAQFASLDATYCVLSSEGPRMEVYGETGVLNFGSEPEDPPVKVFRADFEHEFRGWAVPQAVFRGRVNPPKPRPPAPEYSLASGVLHLVEHLSTGSPLVLTAEHSRHVLEIMVAAQRSAREGSAVDLATRFDPCWEPSVAS